jgi:hypothetical protein
MNEMMRLEKEIEKEIMKEEKADSAKVMRLYQALQLLRDQAKDEAERRKTRTDFIRKGFPKDVVQKLLGVASDVQRPDQDLAVTLCNKSIDFNITVFVESTGATMEELYKRFSDKTGLQDFRLVFNGKTVSDELYRRIAEYAGANKQITFDVVPVLRGGGKGSMGA